MLDADVAGRAAASVRHRTGAWCVARPTGPGQPDLSFRVKAIDHQALRDGATPSQVSDHADGVDGTIAFGSRGTDAPATASATNHSSGCGLPNSLDDHVRHTLLSAPQFGKDGPRYAGCAGHGLLLPERELTLALSGMQGARRASRRLLLLERPARSARLCDGRRSWSGREANPLSRGTRSGSGGRSPSAETR